MISSDEAESPAWICDSEAETIWMSRMAMNIPNTMKMKAASRLTEKCGTAKPGGPTGRAGASGCGLRPERDRVAHGLAVFVASAFEPERAEQGRLRRVGIAGVDGRDDRQAGPQRDLPSAPPRGR